MEGHGIIREHCSVKTAGTLSNITMHVGKVQ